MAEFEITRIFDAPRELVWKAWTETDRLAQWWGPKGLTMKVAKLDLRPGGIFHYCMTTPEGNEMCGKFVYVEIVAPEKLVLINSFSDADGGITRHPWSATWPLEVKSTSTFEAQGDKTLMTLRGAPINASDEEIATYEAGFGSMQQGFTGTFDQLAEYLAGL